MYATERKPYSPFNPSVELDSHRFEEKPSLNDPLSRHVDYLSQNAIYEGLPPNWHELPGIGFSMKAQMELYDTQQDKHTWISQTKRDVLGFALEYLSDKLVYPYSYKYQHTSDGIKLGDPLYGNKDIVDTVDPKEREGSVCEAISNIKSFFVNPDTPDGSMAVMTSILGPTGLTTDEGKSINYPDSYFFIFEKKQDEVKGYTIKTDFSKEEGIKVIERLTGESLDPDMTVADIVRQVSFLPRGLHPSMKVSQDLIRILEQTRKDISGKTTAFQNEKWDDVYKDASDATHLYEFNHDVRHIIDQFEEFANSEEDPGRLQKGLATTILRVSQQFMEKKKEPQSVDIIPGTHTPIAIYDVHNYTDRQAAYAFGEIYKKTSAKGGCAGGGARDKPFGTDSILIDSLVPRLGIQGEESKDKWTYHKGDCREKPVGCGATDTDIGPCGFCKVCEKRPEYNKIS